ncbi:MAG: sodium:proton antiporter [Alphaproteobacteria bacterium]|nr:sodium:proton antiporter [Alphaproteobacteria bacterium]
MNNRTVLRTVLATITAALSSAPAFAAEGDAVHLDGATLDALWAVPFVGLLLSIAIMPLAAPHLWHHHFGKITALWATAFLAPFAAIFGAGLATYEFLHIMLLDYVPFIILLFSLYVISGGVFIEGHIRGTPWTNTGILAGGTMIASIAGTTGASVLLIRPLLRANAGRKYNAHVVVFFIFLVSNIGGSLTPLGDPPLYLGFLKGVDFFWPAQHLWQKTLLLSAILLTAFFFLDGALGGRAADAKPEAKPSPVALKGWLNIFLLLLVPVVILSAAVWKTDAHLDVAGVHVGLPDIARSIALMGLAALSLMLTPQAYRQGNDFTWGPIAEVAKLFAGIFLTIVPVIAMLRAGPEGAFAPLLALLSGPDGQPNNAMYFWLTGGLSSFLDNAPTYLVFFNAAGGDPQRLMTDLATTLTAISAGAVFMGANTYIGNAPNFMVKAIAEEAGIKMPSFFGYMLWSGAVLLPCFALVTWLFFL